MKKEGYDELLAIVSVEVVPYQHAFLNSIYIDSLSIVVTVSLFRRILDLSSLLQ